MKRLSSFAFVLVLVGCGTGPDSPSRVARSQVVKLDWHENCGTPASRLPIATQEVVVRDRRWSVRLSFRNATGVALEVERPHVIGGTLFGLEPFQTTSFREVLKRARTAEAKPRMIADRFRPPLPTLIGAGEGWTGLFSGLGDLPARLPVRIVLGRFVVSAKAPLGLPSEFLCVSDRYVRLR